MYVPTPESALTPYSQPQPHMDNNHALVALDDAVGGGVGPGGISDSQGALVPTEEGIGGGSGGYPATGGAMGDLVPYGGGVGADPGVGYDGSLPTGHNDVPQAGGISGMGYQGYGGGDGGGDGAPLGVPPSMEGKVGPGALFCSTCARA